LPPSACCVLRASAPPLRRKLSPNRSVSKQSPSSQERRGFSCVWKRIRALVNMARHGEVRAVRWRPEAECPGGHFSDYHLVGSIRAIPSNRVSHRRSAVHLGRKKYPNPSSQSLRIRRQLVRFQYAHVGSGEESTVGVVLHGIGSQDLCL